MKRQYPHIFFLTIWLLLFSLTSCQEQKATPETLSTPTEEVPSATATKETLSVEVDEDQEILEIISQSPVEGESLALSPKIEILFNRDMDTEKTSDAWSFKDGNNKIVSGQISWLGARKFTFEPDFQLEPVSLYTGTFSTSAFAEDGESFEQDIIIEFLSEEALTLIQVFPLDNAQDVEETSAITIVFNRPVVPLLIEEEREDLPHPLEFSPEVEGEGEWINSSVYAFTPAEMLTGGTKYRVKIDADFSDFTGNSLGKDFIWSFGTRSPYISRMVLHDNYWYEIDKNINNLLLTQGFDVIFSQPMDAKSVKDAISIIDRESGKNFRFRTEWNEDFTVVSIAPAGSYKLASFYDLRISDSAKAQAGGQLEEGKNIEFTTVPFPKILGDTSQNHKNDKYFSSWVRVNFASPMDEDSLKSRVQISPEPEDWDIYYSPSNWELSIYGLDPDTEYIVRLLPGMADIYGNRITGEYSFTFTTKDRRPSARLVVPHTPLIYRAEGEQQVFFESTNLEDGEILIYKLPFSTFSSMLKDNYNGLKYAPNTTPIKVWDVRNIDEKNELQYEIFNLEDKEGNSLEPGFYLIGLQSESLNYDFDFYQSAGFIVASDNLTFKASATEALAWATDLESGEPEADLSVTFYDEYFNEIGKDLTDEDGIAFVEDLNALPVYVRAESNDRFAFTSMGWGSGVSAGNFGIYQSYYGRTVSNFAHIYSDRPIYRPNQDVKFEGIVRSNDDLSYSLTNWSDIYVRITHQGEEVYAQELSLTEEGIFNGSFHVAEGASLGTYFLTVSQSVNAEPFGTLSFRVAEYHKPEFLLSVEATPENILANEKVNFALEASYYSGGKVTSADVNWFIESSPYHFRPEDSDYSKYNFTNWDRDTYSSSQSNGKDTLAEGQDITDKMGLLEVSEILRASEDKTSQRIYFYANVTNMAGNLVSGGDSVILHQSEVYVGIKSDQYIGKQDEEAFFDLITLNWNSEPVPEQSVTVQFLERRWYSVQEEDDQGTLRWVTSVEEIPVTTERVITDEEGRARTSFIPKKGGVYKVLVTVRDSKGNKHQSSAYTWVSGSNYVSWRQSNDRSFELIADKDNYTPGDTAEILIAQPFEEDSYALITYERGHIYKSEVVLLKGNSTVYELPITKEMAPLSYISVTVLSGAEDSGSPKFKMGMVKINVDTSQQTLDVSVTVDTEKAGPNDEVTYTIETKDPEGNPVSADVSLIVVDKSALALAPPNAPRILDHFYSARSLSVKTSLGIPLSADDFNAKYEKTIPDGLASGGGGGGDSLGIVTVRQNFEDTAFFQSDLQTDENGLAKVTVKLPENLTIWQADVRAVTEDSLVGQDSVELLSTKELLVELATPRFFVAGDQASIGATLHNNGDDPQSVTVSLEATGVDIESPNEQTIEVPSQQQVYLSWDVSVLAVERVDFTVYAKSDTHSDASKPALGTLSGQGIPVYYYSVTETVGTSGMIQSEKSITERIQLPSTIDYTDAKISVEVAPSLVASMAEGLDYLRDYPYLCMEQTVSRILPNVMLARALDEADLPSTINKSGLDAEVSTALQRIYAKQHADGGWSWWDGAESDPYVSAYVVYGLIETEKSGYQVSKQILLNGIGYLNNNLPSLRENPTTSNVNRHAFMVYVLARADVLDEGKTNLIYQKRGLLSLYGKAYLAQALYILDPEDTRISTLISDIEATAIMSAAGVHWEESVNDYWNWNTDLRTTALVLNAFVQIKPDSPLTANAVRWLMAHRESGRWNSTQETAWTLIALTNWLTESGETETNYQYALGLNGEILEEGKASAEALTEKLNLEIELKDLLQKEANHLVFTRGSGEGNLYYTAYLSADLDVTAVPALDQGMSLSRKYYALDDPETPITEIQQGEMVKVRLTMIVPNSLHYLVIDDPLPAGLEAIDSSLNTNMQFPTAYNKEIYKKYGWGWWWYFNHIELRDEKIVLAANYLPAGTYEYTYMARASTIGTFNVIPPTASEFYFPDVGGRGAGSVFTVTP